MGATRTINARPCGVLRRPVPPSRRYCGGAQRWTGARCALMLAMVCRSAAVCGDNILDLPDEECDDGNVYTGDGCSGNCKSERIAFQTFYNSSDCTGKIWKQLVFDDREYVRSKNANAELRYLTGRCLSGIECICLTDEPTCADGSDPGSCICLPPSCADIIAAGNQPAILGENFRLPICRRWTKGVGQNSSNKYSYTTTCMVEFPKMPTVTALSVTGAFVITKHWRLTFSSSPSMAKVADTFAWENTRARAIAHSSPDYWSVVAQKACVPSYATLLPDDRANGQLLNNMKPQFEYHDPITQRVKMGCNDDSCTNCTGEYPMSMATCNTSVTCQMLSPGRCFACSGGLSAKPLEGFEIHPGPPAPAAYRCTPCSQAPTNYFYANTQCRTGLGCGSCGKDLPAWPVVFWPGLACGVCNQKDAPPTACGDQREGGAPYFWVNAHKDIAQEALHPIQSQLLAAEFSSFGNAREQ